MQQRPFSLLIDMGITLRGGEIDMTEQGLNIHQLRSGIQEIRHIKYVEVYAA